MELKFELEEQTVIGVVEQGVFQDRCHPERVSRWRSPLGISFRITQVVSGVITEEISNGKNVWDTFG